MNNIVEIATKIREELRSNRFLCLSALLQRLGEECCADEIGLLERTRNNSEVRVRRTFQLSPDSTFGDRVNFGGATLNNIIREAENSRVLFVRYFPGGVMDDVLGVASAETNDWIIIVPAWPSSNWADNQDARYWLFMWTPRRLSIPTRGDGRGVPAEILALGSEWFGWKHNRLALRKHLFDNTLRVEFDDQLGNERAKRIANDFEFTVVRPVLPKQMANVVRSLIAVIPETFPRLIGIESCRNEYDKVTNLAFPCPLTALVKCSGCNVTDSSSSCPQNEFCLTDRVVAELIIWETGFWREPLLGTAFENEYLQMLQRGFAGLECAAQLLDTSSNATPSNASTVSLPLDIVQLENEHNHTRERLLLRYFVARATKDSLDTFQLKWGGNLGRATTDELQYLENLAQLSVLLLTDDEWSPDAIRNLIRVIAGYGHLILGVPSIIDLARHLRQTLRGESALYTLKQRYRDHFFHTIEVCLIGFALLKSRPEGVSEPTLAESLSKHCQNWNESQSSSDGDTSATFVPVDSQALMSQWWVASLIHDTAYGIDVLKSTLELLNYFGNHEAVGEFETRVKEQI